jgi:hypothetical protein
MTVFHGQRAAKMLAIFPARNCGIEQINIAMIDNGHKERERSAITMARDCPTAMASLQRHGRSGRVYDTAAITAHITGMPAEK